MEMWHAEKHTRYNQLKIDIGVGGWTVHALCVEVGSRGNVYQSYGRMCDVLSFTRAERTELKYEMEKTALHCSHAIVTARYSKEWEPKPLLDVSRWH